MQKLSILEMEEVQGGWLGALACAVVGAGVEWLLHLLLECQLVLCVVHFLTLLQHINLG